MKTPPQEEFSRSRDDDRSLAELARRQHGVISRAQLVRAGIGSSSISERMATGRLHRLHPGVYALGHRLIPKEGWLMAAVLASGPDAVLSLRSAAALWGLRGYSDGAVHVAVPRKSTSTKQIKRHFSVIPDESAG
ncbi:MAG TPA: type IV toxin-antitoxin system AbiEi family antitoxin domain-containing protein [Solirubrobacterales bacterium]|nr:type IV toxin-antitoxin system AbiEi family antitoxin domain-containing protein [Solirubrobacterales bacterium]